MTEPFVPTSMQAVVCHGPKDYRLSDVPVPCPGPGEVLAKIHFSGICASDIKCYQGAHMFWGDQEKTGYCQPPIIAGHEFIGEVAMLGTGAGEKYGLGVGDHVISEQIVPCEVCRFCQNGQYWMCAINDVYGFRQNTPGSWAEYMLFPAKALNHKVPKTLRLEHAAFIEPLACAIHAVEQGNIQLNDTVVIAGCGPLGLGMIATARMKGAQRIIAIDLHEKRLESALKAGADLTLNPINEDVVARVLAETETYGCDVYLEATGHPSGVTQGLDMIRKLGTFVAFSVFSEPTSADWSIIGDRKELTIRGAHLSPHCYPTAIRMLEANLLPMEDIITHKIPLASFQDGIDTVLDGERSVKVLIEPGIRG